MKNKIFLISAACLLSVGLTSCESKISQDEAIALLNSYNATQEFDALNSIVYTSNIITNGVSISNQIIHIDLKDLYYYEFISAPDATLESLIFKTDNQYSMCTSIAGCISISALDAENYIGVRKNSLVYVTSIDAATIAEIKDGNITYIKKGNALTIDGTLKNETTETKRLLELNDRGLITKDEVTVTNSTITQTTTIKVEYNVAITKKTQL